MSVNGRFYAAKRVFFSFLRGTMSSRKASRKKPSPGAPSNMESEEEFVRIPRKLYNHLREAHSLLGKGLIHVRDSAKSIQSAKKKELRTLAAAWTRPELFRACLDDAENCLFHIDGKEVFHIAPILTASLTDCVSNTYDCNMQKGNRKVSKDQQVAHAMSRRLQILGLVSTMARLRNHACSPPIIMMQSYRFYWHGAQHSLLSTNVSSRSLFGPDWFEDMTIKLKDYAPPIFFAVSVGYALFAVDNLEFYEQKKFQRRLSLGLRVWS